jgi:hypothetical protein
MGTSRNSRPRPISSIKIHQPRRNQEAPVTSRTKRYLKRCVGQEKRQKGNGGKSADNADASSSQSKDIEDLRRRLAFNLWKILPAGLDKRDLPLISKTIEILESLLKADHPSLQGVYADDIHKAALDQWVQSLKCLIEYCELIDFEGEECTLNAFLAALPGGCPVDAIKIFITGSSYLSDWSSDKNTAKKVALVLRNLAYPIHRCGQEDMEPLILQFTQELIDWYR